ncbi:cytochrome P450 family protein [Streptomyces hoynatensis]|uniref:Cytochrome P450 n=1 Tax=Streptomyces hoynatensis TaxID=1141874 RepID=A0A3A9YSN4_9ACTN|nr:cytochrome P450 [Streptomyces hoynatensis]RKN38276.1 cytochrome P450 [Streptomyces hoynatensis]
MAQDVIADLAALGQDFARNPYEVFARLRARGPVQRVRTPAGYEAWLILGYEEARAALADPRLVKAYPTAPGEVGYVRPGPDTHLLAVDPPDHTRLRRLVAREFTARRVAALEPRVREITTGLLDAMLAAPSRRADLVPALSFPLPMTVICELLGVPELDREQFRAWSNTLTSAAPVEEQEAAVPLVGAYLADLVEAKRSRPGEDLMSDLIATADEEGDRLSPGELLGMAWILLIAGHETTVNLITNGTLALLTHPDQLALLRGDPSLLEGAVEEMLRYDGPVPTPTVRFTREPTRIAGTLIPAGEVVLPVIADADRDEAKFPEPARFDITRETRGHIAFGHGIHYCLGAPLARLEARVAFAELLARAPGLALDVPAPDALSWRVGMLIRGPVSLPVRW